MTTDQSGLAAICGNLMSQGQIGQDFWVFAEAFNGMRSGYFVDIGAHDGRHISNTFILEKDFGWTGLLIEANPYSFEKLLKTRSSKCLNICLDRAEGEAEFAIRGVMGGLVGRDFDNARPSEETELVRLKTRPLSDVLDEEGAPDVIDFLSIDVEGAEERILLDFDFHRYLFNCMTIERPGRTLRARLAERGYRVVREVPGLDTFFVHKSFAQRYRQNMMAFYQGTGKHR